LSLRKELRFVLAIQADGRV